MLEGNEEARRGCRLEEQVVIKCPGQKKRTKGDNVHREGKSQQLL